MQQFLPAAMRAATARVPIQFSSSASTMVRQHLSTDGQSDKTVSREEALEFLQSHARGTGRSLTAELIRALNKLSDADIQSYTNPTHSLPIQASNPETFLGPCPNGYKKI